MNEKINKLMSQEDKAIAKAVAEGRVDPRTDADQLGTLFPQIPGQKYRRFIKDYSRVKYDDLEAGNVRAEDFDRKHCDTVIIPWLQKDGLILCPIFTTLRPGKTLEEIVSGHHRAFSSNVIWPNNEIPRFILDDDIYECDMHGNVTNPVPINPNQKNYISVVSKMQSNPTTRHKQYKMRDRAQQIHSLIKIDSTLQGLIPSGHTLTNSEGDRELWDKIMDAYVPDQFLGKGARTESFGIFLKMTDDKVLPVTEAAITQILINKNVATGIPRTGRRKKRLPFLKHYCEETNCLIASFDTNGRNIEHKLEALFREAFWRGEFNGYPAGLSIGVVLSIYNPATSLAELNKQRLEAVEKLQDVNRRFVQSGVVHKSKQILVKWAEFPRQLKMNPNDRGHGVTLHAPDDVSCGKTGVLDRDNAWCSGDFDDWPTVAWTN